MYIINCLTLNINIYQMLQEIYSLQNFFFLIL